MPTNVYDTPPAQVAPTNGQPDFDLKAYLPIIATAYGEGADQPYEAKVHIVSSIFNRAESGKAEFGADTGKISDVLKKGYYAYSKQSPKYKEGLEMKFPDKLSEQSFNEFVYITGGILSGKTPRSEAEFFLTPKEVNRIKKDRSMNLDLLEKVDSQGAFDFYRYKPAPPAPVRKTGRKKK